MWGHEEFLGKAKLYFGRAAALEEDENEEVMLWLLLGLEFLLRAPLARIHPALLALPEGDSLLHAVGVTRANARPRSIPTKSVVDRLTKVDPNFGEDRGKEALYLADLRNEELHSAEAALQNASPDVWMPKLLSVVEATCRVLDLDPTDFLAESIIQQAETYRESANRATRHQVSQLIAEATSHYARLTDEEKAIRRAARPSTMPYGSRTVLACPACSEQSAYVLLSEGRPSRAEYDEAAQEIRYSVVRVAESLQCRVCTLTLSTTAQIVAAGLQRLYVESYAEDRHEGWEELMTYEDAARFLGADDYGND